MDNWLSVHNKDRLLDIDFTMSYGVFEMKYHSNMSNNISFIWNPGREASIFIKINCISTEFTSKRHGGERGSPLRLIVETFTLDDVKLSSASCVVKVFKSKGAERKHKTDRDRISKIPDSERYYIPSYDCTLLTAYDDNDDEGDDGVSLPPPASLRPPSASGSSLSVSSEEPGTSGFRGNVINVSSPSIGSTSQQQPVQLQQFTSSAASSPVSHSPPVVPQVMSKIRNIPFGPSLPEHILNSRAAHAAAMASAHLSPRPSLITTTLAGCGTPPPLPTTPVQLPLSVRPVAIKSEPQAQQGSPSSLTMISKRSPPSGYDSHHQSNLFTEQSNVVSPSPPKDSVTTVNNQLPPRSVS